jgi:hypothetical protein
VTKIMISSLETDLETISYARIPCRKETGNNYCRNRELKFEKQGFNRHEQAFWWLDRGTGISYLIAFSLSSTSSNSASDH